jgi:hypothetical protein
VITLKVIETEKPLPVSEEAKKAEPEAEVAPPASPDAAAAGTEDKVVAAPAEAPPAPAVEIIKNVELEIKRKFQIHDDPTRKWVKADPGEHPVGYTVVHLLDAIEKRLASGADAEKVEQANLNINPPVIVR